MNVPPERPPSPIRYYPQYNFPTNEAFGFHRFKGDGCRVRYAKYSFAAATYYLYTIGYISREDHEQLKYALLGRPVPRLSTQMNNMFVPVQIRFTPKYDRQTNTIHRPVRYTGDNCLQNYAVKQCEAAATYLRLQRVPFSYPVPTISPRPLLLNMNAPLTTVTPVHHLPVQHIPPLHPPTHRLQQQPEHGDRIDNDDVQIIDQHDVHVHNDDSSVTSTLSTSSSVPSREPSVRIFVESDRPDSNRHDHISFTSSQSTGSRVARMPDRQQHYQLPQPVITFVDDFAPPRRLPARKSVAFHTKRRYVIYTKGKSRQDVLLEHAKLLQRYWTSFGSHMHDSRS
jgi:hypothetical protein